jgi:hypothetical protein
MLLSIKYYKFDSSFDTSEFLQRKITRRCGSDTLIDTRTTPCPKIPPSAAVNAYGSLSTDSTIESEPLTGNCSRHHRKGEKNYLHKLEQ